MFQSFCTAIDIKITSRILVTIQTLVDTVDQVVLNRCLLSVRRIRYLKRLAITGHMGHRWAKVMVFFPDLNIEVNAASLLTLDWRSITIFSVLGDLNSANPEEVLLSQYLLTKWKEFEDSVRVFNLPICEATIVKWWQDRK